jgi:hypothetical protein
MTAIGIDIRATAEVAILMVDNATMATRIGVV